MPHWGLPYCCTKGPCRKTMFVDRYCQKKGRMVRTVRPLHGHMLKVWRLNAYETHSGKTRFDYMRNKRGRIVSKLQHRKGLKAYGQIELWTCATMEARKILGVKGFLAMKKGTQFYKTAKQQYLRLIIEKEQFDKALPTEILMKAFLMLG